MKNLLRLSFAVTIITALLMLSSCSPVTTGEQDKLTVAVSIVPQAAFVKEVAGDLVDVVTVIPPSKSPANYSPTPQELVKLSQSSIYFTVGVASEQSSIMPKLKDINSSIKIINMSDVVRAQYPDREFSPGQRDPHIWLSLKRAIVMVECIAQELSSLDGKNSGTYRENASNYIRKLETLDKEIEESFKSLKNKAFIVYHPSLGYYADDYGLTMLAIQAEGKDATPDDLQKVINDAWKFGIKTVFFQAEIDSRHSEVIAEEIDGKAVEISPLSPDYIDSLKEITASIISSN